MTPKERAEAHWNGYVGPMMETMMKCMMDMSRFHYISSHVHGDKHGQEHAAAQPPIAGAPIDLCATCSKMRPDCGTVPGGDTLACSRYEPRK